MTPVRVCDLRLSRVFNHLFNYLGSRAHHLVGV